MTSSYSHGKYIIVAWDITISKWTLKEKLNKFWVAFNQFKDKNCKYLNKQTEVSLEYIILVDKK